MEHASTRYRPPAFDDFELDTWTEIIRHFLARHNMHVLLNELLESGEDEKYARHALGLTENSVGNYSAAEHEIHLGNRILHRSSFKDVAGLARDQLLHRDCWDLPAIVAEADIPYLKVSVGSEMMCLLRPESCWITNKRTVYVYLLKHRCNDDWEKANELLRELTKSGGVEDTYDKWGEMHPNVVHPLLAIAEAGRAECSELLKSHKALKKAAAATLLWADAIASQVFTWATEWE